MEVIIIKETIGDTEVFRDRIIQAMDQIRKHAELQNCVVQPFILQQAFNETYIIETIIYDLIPMSAINPKVIRPQ